MAKPTAPQCHAMTTYYMNAYREVNGRDCVVNRNKARFGFEGILTDFTKQQAQELVLFFIKKYPDRNLEWFFYNYESVVERMRDDAEREAAAVERRKETEQRLLEWRKRWEK